MENRIKDLRDDMDLRQSDLAKATGIDQRTISNYETGKTVPDAYALVQLANYFDVSIDYLLCRTTYDTFSFTKREKIITQIQALLEELKKI